MTRKPTPLIGLLLVSSIVISGCNMNILVPRETGSVKVSDDYYEFVNHKLLEKTEIPADEGAFTQFSDLGNSIYNDLNNIVEDTVEHSKENKKGTSSQRIADLYLNAQDYNTRNAAGLSGYKTLYDSILGAETIPEYLEAISNISKVYGQYSLFAISPEVDMKDSSQYVAYIGEPDLILEKEILEDTNSENLWSSYKTYVKNIFVLLGDSEVSSEKTAQELFDFQKDLAASCLNSQDRHNPAKTFNPHTKEVLANLFTHIDIVTLLEQMGEGDWDNYIVTNPEVYKKVNTYLTEEHLELLKKYSILILMHDNGIYLSEEFQNNYLEFDNIINGAKEKYTRDKQASKMVQDLLAWDFGKIYVEEYFSKEEKREVEAMINQIIAAYEQRIDELDWMSDITKKAAKVKLNTIKVKVGYPDKWPDYMYQIKVVPPEEGGVLADNQLSILATTNHYMRNKVRRPVDKMEWHMTPQTVNAYYNPTNNEIVFPAAILQNPFYDKSGSYAQNLGGIGMVIAHEITHAFDTNGAQYDENGNFNNWWTDEDYKNFEGLSQQVVNYYGRFEAFEGRFVNGELTVSENIADLGALNCVTSIVGNDKENLQKLFQQFALIWAAKMTDEKSLMLVNTDVHSPAKVRVNAGAGATDAFYTAYDVEEGDDMYIASDERPRIW